MMLKAERFQLKIVMICKIVYFKQILQELISQFFQPGKYIACIYDQQWHIRIIMKRSEKENDVLSWPQNTNDECWIPFQDVLCFISAPEHQGHSGRNYRISSSDKDLILSIITNE